ncbi:MAG: hypothetical protein LAO03_17525 [Acidobacteriia bacterium]|nr:hypothetical protein [Terriglobia bacterium]
MKNASVVADWAIRQVMHRVPLEGDDEVEENRDAPLVSGNANPQRCTACAVLANNSTATQA